MSIGSTSWYKLKEFATNVRHPGQISLPWGIGSGAAAGAVAGAAKTYLQDGLQFLLYNDVLRDLDWRQTAAIVGTGAAAIVLACQAANTYLKDKASKLHYTVRPGDAGTMNEKIEGILYDSAKNSEGLLTNGLAAGAPAGTVPAPADHRTKAFGNLAKDIIAVYASKGTMPLTGKGKKEDNSLLWGYVAPSAGVPGAIPSIPATPGATNASGMSYKVELGIKKGETDIAYVKTYRKDTDDLWFNKMVGFQKFTLGDAGEYKMLEHIV